MTVPSFTSALTVPVRLRSDAGRRWLEASALVVAAALLSAAQIWLRQTVSTGLSRVETSSLALLALTNLIAWAPWVPLGLAVAGLSRSLIGASPMLRALGHVAGSQVVTWAFLAYLALFRSIFVPAVANRYLEDGWSRLVAREASDFYLICLLLYAAIAMWVVLRRRDAVGGPGVSVPVRAADGRIEVRSVSRTRWVPAKDVEWIEAAGNYSRLHTGERSVLHRQPLKQLVSDLAEHGFVRIHRSHAVRASRVEAVEPRSHGDAEVTLYGGRVLRVSRRYRPGLVEVLQSLGPSGGSPHEGSHSSRRA